MFKDLYPIGRIDRLVYQEKKNGWKVDIPSTEDYVDTTIQELEEYTKRSKKRLLTAANKAIST